MVSISVPAKMPFLVALFLLVPFTQLCVAMNKEVIGDIAASCVDGGAKCCVFVCKLCRSLSKSLSEFGKICDIYTILPRAQYTIYVIFGEFDNIHDKLVQKIDILTDGEGVFRWNFDELVVQNSAVAPKDHQKVTVLLCRKGTDECRTFREYGTYAEMKRTQTETEKGRFYGCFQVMYEHLPEMSRDKVVRKPSEKRERIDDKNSPPPKLPLSTFPSFKNSSDEEESENETAQSDHAPLLLGDDGGQEKDNFSQHIRSQGSLRHRPKGQKKEHQIEG